MKYRNLLICSCAALSGVAVPALAADSPPAPAEIVVTAQKRSETINKVPIAITAISGADLLNKGVVNVKDLTSIVPNVQIHTIGLDSFVGIAIRGISNGTYTPDANPAVSTYVDGIYVDLPVGFADELYDLDRIEVLRGPQGTLYGRNATGGNLNIVTADPKNKFGGSADISYGRYNDVLGHVTVNVPLSDTLAVRASGFVHRSDGMWNTQGTTARNYGASDDFGGRVTALFKPSPVFSWRLSVDTIHVRGTPGGSIATGNDGKPLDGLPVFSQPAPSDPEPKNLIDSTTIRSRMEVTPIDAVTLSYIAGYQHIGAGYRWATTGETGLTPLGAYRENYNYKSEMTSHEIDVAYTSDRFKNVAGANYFWAHTPSELGSIIYPVYGIAGPALPSDGTRKRSWGVFDQATFSPVPELRITAGVRYSHDRESEVGVGSVYCLTAYFPGLTVLQAEQLTPTTPGCFPSGPPGPPASGTSHKVTWKGGVDYDLARGVLAYASVSTGYKQGGVQPNAPAPFSQQFAPETVTSYEVGLKGRFFDQALGLQLSGFYTDYKDLQIFQFIGLNAKQSAIVTTNAGAAHIYGAELEGNLAVTRNDHLSGFLTYTHARFTKFDNAVDSRTGEVLPSLAGNQLANAPDLTVRVQYAHVFTLQNGGTLSPQASLYYQTRSFTQFINEGAYRIQPYTRTDLNLTYTSPEAHWTLSAFVLNAENNIVKNSDFSGPNIVYSDFSPPRTWGVRAGYKF